MEARPPHAWGSRGLYLAVVQFVIGISCLPLSSVYMVMLRDYGIVLTAYYKIWAEAFFIAAGITGMSAYVSKTKGNTIGLTGAYTTFSAFSMLSSGGLIVESTWDMKRVYGVFPDVPVWLNVPILILACIELVVSVVSVGHALRWYYKLQKDAKPTPANNPTVTEKGQLPLPVFGDVPQTELIVKGDGMGSTSLLLEWLKQLLRSMKTTIGKTTRMETGGDATV